MKKYFLDKAISLIKKNDPTINDIKIDRIRYGLEGIYLTLTKLVIISSITIYIGFFTEFLIFTIFYNIIRIFAFGLHAPKSHLCLILSSLFFIILPCLATVVSIPFYLKVISCISLFIIMLLYAPADTHKRPLIKEKKRRQWKMLSLFVTTIYIMTILMITNEFISNVILFALIVEGILISPISYKLLKLPYKNYLLYQQRGS